MKKIILLNTLIAISVSLAFGQQNPVEVKYANTITPQDLKKHLTILASDEYGGRETGQKGAEMASDYIANYFKGLGLQAPVNGSYFQNIPLVEKSLDTTIFMVNGKSYGFGTDFLVSGSSNPDKIQIKTNEIVFAGYGIQSANYNDLKDVSIKGKPVIVMYGEPVGKNGLNLITQSNNASEYTANPRKRIDDIKAMEPSVIFIVLEGMRAKFGNNHLKEKKIEFAKIEKNNGTRIPVVYISNELADVILGVSHTSLDNFKAKVAKSTQPQSKAIKLNLDLNIQLVAKPINARNVLGFLPGSDLKDEVLVITAHYDHIGVGTGDVFNGADDDGSGTTAVMELAEAFMQAKNEGKGPRRSILFMTVVGEEKGLLGSEWYSEHPVFPLEKTITDLNIDMIGRIDPEHAADSNYVYIIGSDKLSTDLHNVNEQANKTYTKLNLDYKYNDPNDPNRFYYRSDHYNFAKHNIPIIFYFNGVHADYHKPSDEVSKIVFPLQAKRAQLVFYTAWELANSAKRPVVNVKNNFPSNR
ncbi:M28 family peptidase [Solitalea koreensis]|uniref:Peptidase family M28 n=1 Tax=Solitalea koreensis TaxID=543615 RepID=A0A521AQU0_9SPHI|nr:M28 family peptidase [Solitalea koreensis]SMO37178.1 Peptidase family M28 [Solitalea koreensis]